MTFVVVSLFLGGSLFLLFSGSPFFGVFGVLLHALAHSCLLCLLGLSFFALLTVIVYVGGMLVVFLFSTVLSADRFPEFSWKLFGGFFGALMVVLWPLVCGDNWDLSFGESFVGLVHTEGFNSLFCGFGAMACVVGGILLLALVAVLDFGFEHGQGALRKL